MKKKKVIRRSSDIGKQLKRHTRIKGEAKNFKPHKGNLKKLTSTGSTLLDLAISGGVSEKGGIPSGIFVEVFGPSGSGKTVLLCEIAGNIQRKGGELMFHDPEARLNKQFAKIFDLNIEDEEYFTPDTVPEVFSAIRNWEVKDASVVNGVITDSLAALSTDLEMASEEGDKMGQRRAKEFSQELRRTARIIKNKDYLVAASNQIRTTMAGHITKHEAPGGFGIGFYSSVRLRFGTPKKIVTKSSFKGKKIEKVTGVETEVEVFKSSVDDPFRKALLIIDFHYGIDDIRANVRFLRKYLNAYKLNGESLGASEDAAVLFIEKNNLEEELQQEVISLWREIESKFDVQRKPKAR